MRRRYLSCVVVLLLSAALPAIAQQTHSKQLGDRRPAEETSLVDAAHELSATVSVKKVLAGNLVHRTVPGLADRAYLTAVTTSPEEYPLLAGTVRAFTAGAYLGAFPLKETGPGVELTLPFGVDNRIEIVRVPEPEMQGRGGFAGKYRVVQRTERTQIHNLLDREATLVLEERLPVSTDERIEVELGEETTPGFKDSPRRPGVKIWTLTLAAGEQREVRFDYSVKFPREMNLPGLSR